MGRLSESVLSDFFLTELATDDNSYRVCERLALRLPDHGDLDAVGHTIAKTHPTTVNLGDEALVGRVDFVAVLSWLHNADLRKKQGQNLRLGLVVIVHTKKYSKAFKKTICH